MKSRFATVLRARVALASAILAATAAAVLAPLPATAATAARTAGSPEVVVISANGAPLADILQQVFAILLPTPPPTEFAVTPVSGGVELTDRATGGVVYAPGTEPLTQLAVAPAGQTPANSAWILRDADGNTLHSVPASGMYTLELAGTDQYIGRAPVEDRSLLPKKVVLLSAGSGPYMLAMERIS
jgi:hypothetical protein